jgi:hypothetical protein
MTIFLDHQQRLNLISLMGMQRGTVAEIRQWWSLQDQLELTEQEKLEIGYRVIMQNGMEVARWDRPLPPRPFDLNEGNYQRIHKIVESFPEFQVIDRKWIESLLSQFEASNGNKSPVSQ